MPVLGQAIVVDQSELKPEDILTSKPLIGYRPISREFFAKLAKPNASLALPLRVVYDSARQSDWGSSISNLENQNGLRLNDDMDVRTYRDWLNSIDKTQWRPQVAEVPMIEGSAKVDPHILASLPTTELASGQEKTTPGKNEPVFPVPNAGHRADRHYLLIDRQALDRVQGAYNALEMASDAPPSSQPVYVHIAAKNLDQLPEFAKASEFKAGQVTFGKPIVRKVSEPGPNRSIIFDNNSDLVLVILAVSIRDISADYIKSIVYSVSAKPGAVAYDLVPLSVLNSPPEIQQGAIVKLTGLDVQLKDMKPKVIAEGLQESAFSWVITGGAIESRSYRFVALLQVPKSVAQLAMNFTVVCQTKGGYLSQGSLLLQTLENVPVPLQ